MTEVAITLFQGRVADHNNLAIPGAKSVARMLAEQLGVGVTIVGAPAPALSAGWQIELNQAMPGLHALAAQLVEVFARRAKPLSATSRCAASLATLPVVARYRPDACVVWFDAHADLNTPSTTGSGYLGGMALSGPAGLWDSGLGAGLALSNVVLVGQRSLDPSEANLIASGAVTHVAPGPELADRLRAAVGGRAVYMHLDCDVLNPGIVPTDYVHEDGLSLEDLRAACAVLAESEMIGVEIAEFQDAWEEGGEPVSPAALIAALAPVLKALR
ncbi:MAG: arginase family protein [Pseudomonadota bacterium]